MEQQPQAVADAAQNITKNIAQNIIPIDVLIATAPIAAVPIANN
jgi:hypothetical protein